MCFCCVRFSFSISSQEVGLGNVSEMTYLVSYQVGRKTATQSLSVDELFHYFNASIVFNAC